MDAHAIWRGKNDEEVLTAYTFLDDFTDEGRDILRAEVERRGLAVPALLAPIPISTGARSAPLPDSPFARLWAGGYSLPLTYWGWGMGGMFLWRGASAAVLSVVPAALVLAAALLLLLGIMTYSVVVGVGLWRSANRYTGRPVWAVLAKVVVAANASAFAMRIIYQLFGPR